MAEVFNIPYLGKLPMDPNLTRACEGGESFTEKFPKSIATSNFNNICDKIIKAVESD